MRVLACKYARVGCCCNLRPEDCAEVSSCPSPSPPHPPTPKHQRPRQGRRHSCINSAVRVDAGNGIGRDWHNGAAARDRRDTRYHSDGQRSALLTLDTAYAHHTHTMSNQATATCATCPIIRKRVFDARC
jgi:hypothetical protein